MIVIAPVDVQSAGDDFFQLSDPNAGGTFTLSGENIETQEKTNGADGSVLFDEIFIGQNLTQAQKEALPRMQERQQGLLLQRQLLQQLPQLELAQVLRLAVWRPLRLR